MSKDEERYDVSQHEGHAEGPWTIECYERAWYIYGEKGDDYVCDLSGIAQRKDPTAKLLAATPEILNALKKAYEMIDGLRRNWVDYTYCGVRMRKEIPSGKTFRDNIDSLLGIDVPFDEDGKFIGQTAPE